MVIHGIATGLARLVEVVIGLILHVLHHAGEDDRPDRALDHPFGAPVQSAEEHRDLLALLASEWARLVRPAGFGGSACRRRDGTR